jgi:3-methyladenine DNA glycosylase AlkD
VDVTAEHIIGAYLDNGPRDMLFQLARDENLWARRVAIISTFHFIRRSDATTTLQISELLLADKHDLIHKAVGWMLREVGKRCDEKVLIAFLDSHAHHMPRTTLRYAIERLSPELKSLIRDGAKTQFVGTCGGTS